MIQTIVACAVCFIAGVIFSEAVRAWFGREEASVKAKLDELLKRTDPNATTPPK